MKKIITLTAALSLSALLFVGCEDIDINTDDVQTETQAEETQDTSILDEDTPSPVFETMKKYDAALVHLQNGEYEQAYDIFLTIEDYKDVKDYLACFSFKYDTEIVITSRYMEVTTYEYDRYGNVLKDTYLTDSGGAYSAQTVTYSYDADKNVTTRTRKTSAYDETYIYEHDQNGNIVRMLTPANRVVVYTYDTNGNLTNEIWSIQNGEIIRSYSYEYDSQNRKTNYSYRNADGHSFDTTYEYDERGCMTKETEIDENNWIHRWEYAYDDAKNVISKRYSCNGVYSYLYEYKYDTNGNKTEEIYTNKYDDYNKYTWTYDNDGKLIQYTRQSNSSTSTHIYEYDDRGNQIKATYSLDGKVEAVHTYEYDDRGNRVKSVSPGYTDAEDDKVVTLYYGYKLYYNPYPNAWFPEDCTK